MEQGIVNLLSADYHVVREVQRIAGGVKIV